MCVSDLNADRTREYSGELHSDITLDEGKKVINHANNNKSVVIDNLPLELSRTLDMKMC